MVLKLLSVHAIEVRISIKENRHSSLLAKTHGICQVGPHPKCREDLLVWVCTCIYENPNNLCVATSNRKTQRSLIIKVTVADNVQVVWASTSEIPDNLGVSFMYRAMKGVLDPLLGSM